MWHISGVAFHALPLGEHIPEALVKLGIWKFDCMTDPQEVNFTTLSIARDLRPSQGVCCGVCVSLCFISGQTLGSTLEVGFCHSIYFPSLHFPQSQLAQL